MKRVRHFLKYVGGVVLVLLIAALGAPYLIPIAPYSQQIEAPFENSQYTQVDGVRLHYRYWEPGSDPKGNVALIHGFSGSTFSWRETIPDLVGDGWGVLAVDLPAFGYSDRSPGIDHSAGARSAYVWGVIDHLAETEGVAADGWVVFGHSMGGGVIDAMALTEPDRTAGVVFVDGGGRTRNREPSLSGRVRSAAMGFGPLRRWVEVYAKYRAFNEDNIRELLTSAMGQEPSDEAVQGYLAALNVPRTASAIMDQWRSRGGAVQDFDPSEITAPTLIVWGENDSWVPIERGKWLDENIEDSEMIVIDGAGHNPMETHAEGFNEAVLDFLNTRVAKEERDHPSQTE